MLILQIPNEASALEKTLSFFDYMAVVISCCSFSFHGVPDRLVEHCYRRASKEIFQHRLFGNMKECNVSLMAAVFTHLVFSRDCDETCIRICKNLSQKKITLAMVYFTLTALQNAALDSELCTRFLALLSRLLSEEVQDSDSCRTRLYNVLLALPAKVNTATTAAGRTFRDVSITQLSAPDLQKTVDTQDFISAAMFTFQRSEKYFRKVLQFCS